MHLIVPHLLPSTAFSAGRLAGPAAPALETLVARGRQTSTSAVGLEGALCRAWGISRQQDWPWAPLSLSVDGGTPDKAYWLRTDPVHIRIQRDRLILLGNELLELNAEEAADLCADLHAHLATPSIPCPCSRTAGTGAWNRTRRWKPRPFPGRRTSIDTLLPRGTSAMKWRVLLNEIQMLLTNHPVNQQREARSLPMINSVWAWGGGRASRRFPFRVNSVARTNICARSPNCWACRLQLGRASLRSLIQMDWYC